MQNNMTMEREDFLYLKIGQIFKYGTRTYYVISETVRNESYSSFRVKSTVSYSPKELLLVKNDFRYGNIRVYKENLELKLDENANHIELCPFFIFTFIGDSLNMNEKIEEVKLPHSEDEVTLPQYDIIQKAPHYNTGDYEVIEVIKEYNLGFCLGNAVKYIARAGRKDASKTIEDLKKACYYIEREVSYINSNKFEVDFKGTDFVRPHVIVNDWKLNFNLGTAVSNILYISMSNTTMGGTRQLAHLEISLNCLKIEINTLKAGNECK